MNNVKVIFDIETVPNLPKDEIKDIISNFASEEEKDNFTKDYILSPTKNKIVSISTVVLIPDENPSLEIFFSTENEKEVVVGFYNMLKDIKEAGYDFTLVGFNINYFDIPVFKAKASKYIPTKDRCNLLELKPWESFDIFEKLGKRCSLVDWLDFYELPKKYKNLTGENFLRLYLEDDVETMKNYSIQDAKSEAKLYKQVEGI